MNLRPEQIHQIRETVWGYYHEHAREMPWRRHPSPFNVWLSEMMLQQTQVSRVIPKFEAFLYTCDSFAELAELPLSKVLELWSGLGYNRRAKFLHAAAQMIVSDYGGQLPNSVDELVKLPGVGRNTAGAIAAYVYNQPVVFVETNIRTVLFHHVFDGQKDVSDRDILQAAEQLLDVEHPREWYWALMDYGSFLKSTAGGRNDASKHYKKQSPLAGSLREMRGRILKTLVSGSMDEQSLRTAVAADERFEVALADLVREGFVERHFETYCLTGYTEPS